MALIMKYIDSMHRYMDSHGDPRTKDWPFMSSPFPTLAVCLSYVYIVKVLGPRLMENRKPFHLQNTLIVYNLSQVIFSAWLFYECLMGGWWGQYSFRCEPVDHSNSPTAMRIALSGWLTGHYNFRCQPVDYSNHPKTLRMVHACWWYYFSKFTEFMDTLFFVLRKKTSQVSTLHVIHHGCMPMSVWFGVKFTPGGHSTFFGLLNTFVHIVMYTYYLFAAMGPRYQKFLWWKKYLTALQMVQFVAIMVHAFQLLFIDCNYPRAFVWWIGLHAVMFFFLFNEFYKSAYRNDKAKLIAARNMLKCLLGMPYKSRSTSNLKQALPASKANGHCNGTTAPLSNGKMPSNDTKDTQYQNGTTPNGHAAEHYSSSEETRTITSTATKAADYYVRGELPTEITQRKIQK